MTKADGHVLYIDEVDLLADLNVSVAWVLIRKFVPEAISINPIPIADRFSKTFASLIGARHLTTE